MKIKIIPEQKICLYEFSELSKEAKETALQNWQCDSGFYDYYDQEMIYTLKRINEALEIDIRRSDYNDKNFYNADYSRNISKKDAEKMDFKRTIAYINNHFNFTKYNYSFRKKVNEIAERKTQNNRINCRIYWNMISNKTALALKKYEENDFSGVWCDYVLQDTYNKFIDYHKKQPAFYNSFADFCDLLASEFSAMYQSEYDFYYSMENLEELSNINDWYYLENGEAA